MSSSRLSKNKRRPLHSRHRRGHTCARTRTRVHASRATRRKRVDGTRRRRRRLRARASATARDVSTAKTLITFARPRASALAHAPAHVHTNKTAAAPNVARHTRRDGSWLSQSRRRRMPALRTSVECGAPTRNLTPTIKCASSPSTSPSTMPNPHRRVHRVVVDAALADRRHKT